MYQQSNISVQGPSKLLFTMKDNEYYQKHRQQLKETDRVLDTLTTEHLVPISNAKAV